MAESEVPAAPGDAPAAAARPPSARRGFVRRWTRRSAWFGLFGVLTLVALYLTRDRVLHPALCRLATWGGARAGYDVRIDRLRTDWWSAASLEGVDVRATAEDGALGVLELDVARATFSVPALVRGGLAGLGAVEVGRGRVELDLRGSGEPDGESDAGGSFRLPEVLPRVSAASLALRLVTDGGSLEVDDLHVATRGETYAVDAGRAAWSGGVEVSAPVAVEAVWGAYGRIAFRDLELGPLVHAGAGEVDLRRVGEGALEVSVALGLPEDGRVEARLSLADGALELDLAESRIALAPTVAAVAAVGLPTPGIETLGGVANLRGELRAGAGTAGFETRVHLAGRDVSYEGRRAATLVADATIRPAGLRFDRVEAREGDQVVVVTDSTLPFSDLLEGLSGAVEVDVGDLAGWIRGAEAPSGTREVPPHRLVLRGEVGAGRVRLDAGRLDVAGGHVDVRAGALDLVPAVDGERRLELDLSLDLPQLAELGELLGASDWAGRLSGDVRLEGPLTAPVGRAQLAGEDVAVAGLRLGAVSVDAEADGNEVRVARLGATSDVLHLESSGAWNLKTQRFQDARAEVALGGLEAFGFAPGGSLSLTARIDGPWDAPTGSLGVTGSALAIAGTPLEDFALDARADDGVVTVSRAGARTPYGALALTGVGSVSPAGRVEIELATLVAIAGESDLRLTAPTRLVRDESGFSVAPFELAGTAGRLSGEARFAAGVWTGRLDSEALRLEAFVASVLPAGFSTGPIDASLASGPNASLDFDARLADVVVGAGALPATVALAGRWADETVALDSLSIALAGRDVLRAHGRLPLPHLRPDAPLELAATLSLAPDFPVAFPLRGETARLTADVEGDVSLSGTWRAPRGSVSIVGRELSVTPASLVQPFLTEPARVDLELALGENVELTRLELVLPARLTSTATGTISGPLDLARLARGDLDGLRASEVSAKGLVAAADPAWAAELLGARRLGGTWRADWLLRGSIDAPEASGNLAVQAGSIKYPGVPEVEQIGLDLGLSSAGLEVRTARAELGSAEVTLTGHVENGPAGPVLDLALTGENVLLQRSSRLRLRGDLALALRGAPDELVLSGDVHLVNSRFLQQVDFLSLVDVRGGGVSSAQRGIALPSFREGPLATMKLDVNVKAREPVSLFGNLARGKIGLDLHLGGTGEVLVPRGIVFLDEGRVALPGGPMKFERGLITFRAEDPTVPRLDLTAETRLAGYDLELRIEGPIDDLQVEITSFPPLDRGDALLLVLTGQVPPTGEATSTAAQSLGLYLAKDLARRWASDPSLSDEDREGVLDRLNLVSGQDVSRSGVMTLEVSYRTFDGVLGDGDSIFVVGERDVYEDYNIGLRFVFRSQ